MAIPLYQQNIKFGMQISKTNMEILLLKRLKGRGTMPWLTMWISSSLDLEVSWSSAAGHACTHAVAIA